MNNEQYFDVIIIGGSYAGLSAAMALGRSMRNVLVIDSGLPCNRQAPHSHNFITQDGEEPAVIAARAKQQVLQYRTVQFLDDLVISGQQSDGRFIIGTQGGAGFSAAKLIFATGVKDILPDIKGLAACWGISVIHCPYCHGYEFRGQKTVILANGEKAMHLSSLVSNLTNDITLITSGKADFSDAQLEKLHRHRIPVLETAVVEVVHEQGMITHLVLSDGCKLDARAMYAAVPFVQHCDVPVALGCELTEMGHLRTDMFQKTTVEGVFACGDCSSMMRSVAWSVASGNIAGVMVNKELTDDRF